MNLNALLMAVLLVLLPLVQTFSQEIFINEFMASNSATIADSEGGFDDWVELYNGGATPVDIGGMYVTDDLLEPTKWQIPTSDPSQTTIAPGGYLLLWFDGEPAQGPLHVDPKLGAGGEDIGLFASDGSTQIDALTFGQQNSDVSYGRLPDGGVDFQFFNNPTPGAANEASQGNDQAEAPEASVTAGFYNSPFSVELSSTTPNAAIYYTLDGSEPTDASNSYMAAITVSQSTTLRAKAYAPNLDPSKTATFTYLFEVSHTFPVVALSFNNDDFFDPATGIYPNFEEDWERPVNVEFFETDGSLSFNEPAVAEIHGTGSATLPQKSLRIESKPGLGSGQFNHSIFPDLQFDNYPRFLLRNSGQDWNITMFRDAMVASLTADLSDVGNIIQQPDMHHQGFRPSIVYLNGEYWGIHNLREHMQDPYVTQHFGLKDNEIDLLDNDEIKEGSDENWEELSDFLNTSDFSSDAILDQFAQKVNLPHFLDYYVANIIIDNSDWPGNNYRRWRAKDNGKWNFMTFDLDFTFGLFSITPGGNTWNTGDATPNSLARSLDDSQILWPNPHWKTLFFRKPMENEQFRTDFINRTADFLNVLFASDRVNARIDEFVATYSPEYQQHFDKWSSGWNPVPGNVEKLRSFANERPANMRQHVVGAFSEVTGTADVTLQANPSNGGTIEFSTLSLTPANLPWSGEYFRGVEIPVKAIPAPGYVFDGWSLGTLGGNATGTVMLSGDLVLVANFIFSGTAVENVIINEINYNSPDAPNSGDWLELYNPENQTVDLSGWTLEDEDGGLFTMPNGTVIPPNDYLVLVEVEAEFVAVYPSVNNFLGSFGDGVTGFKFSNNNELLVLKNASAEVIDSVHYDDESPWPAEADGDGPTLQLTDHFLDNALATSWIAQAPTPGAINIVTLQPQTINFPAIPDKLTTDAPFNVSASASSGLDVTFEIVSGPASIAGNIITLNGTEGTVVVRATQSGDSNWEAATPVQRSFQVTEDVVSTEYCGSSGQQPWIEWIGKVEFGGINHASGKNQYGNFTSISTTVAPGQTVGLTVTPVFSWTVYDEYIRVWIDYNQDFDFNDAGEMILEGHGTGAISANVTIPTNAAFGQTRMRVSMQRNQYAGPCDLFTVGEVEDYSVVIGSSGLIPQTIDFPAISDKNTTSPPFTLAATASSGLPVSYEIVSGPATVSGNTVTLTGTSGVVTVRAKQSGNAQYEAATPVNRTFTVVNIPPPPPPGTYCKSQGSQPWHEWIRRVQFGSIDHISFKNQYGNFINISTNAVLGETMVLTVEPDFSWEVFDEYIRVWIDFNQDFDFDDPGEMVMEAHGTTAQTANVTIPASAALGQTRMRVSMRRGQYPAACGDFVLGEVEDYTVNITPNMPSLPVNDGLTVAPKLLLAPNPVSNAVTARFSLAEEGSVKLSIISLGGHSLLSEEMELQAGWHQITFDVAAFESGTYAVFIQPAGQKAMVERFVKME